MRPDWITRPVWGSRIFRTWRRHFYGNHQTRARLLSSVGTATAITLKDNRSKKKTAVHLLNDSVELFNCAFDRRRQGRLPSEVIWGDSKMKETGADSEVPGFWRRNEWRVGILSISIETFFSLVAFLVKWQITGVGSVTDMSQKPSHQSEAPPRFIKLMTESTSTATQAAAAPSSQKGWNLTFHLIKSCRNSDLQLGRSGPSAESSAGALGCGALAAGIVTLKSESMSLPGYSRKRERFAAFFQPNISGFNHLLPTIESTRPMGIRPGGCLFNSSAVPETSQLSWNQNKSRCERTDWMKWVPTKEEV